jgi:hypothetical protein
MAKAPPSGPGLAARALHPGSPQEHEAFQRFQAGPPSSPLPTGPQGGAQTPFTLYLGERFLSLRVFRDYRAIVDACCDAWYRLVADPGRLRSLCDQPWIRNVTS